MLPVRQRISRMPRENVIKILSDNIRATNEAPALNSVSRRSRGFHRVTRAINRDRLRERTRSHRYRDDTRGSFCSNAGRDMCVGHANKSRDTFPTFAHGHRVSVRRRAVDRKRQFWLNLNKFRFHQLNQFLLDLIEFSPAQDS